MRNTDTKRYQHDLRRKKTVSSQFVKIQDEPISRLKRFNEKRDEKNIFRLKFNAHANL